MNKFTLDFIFENDTLTKETIYKLLKGSGIEVQIIVNQDTRPAIIEGFFCSKETK